MALSDVETSDTRRPGLTGLGSRGCEQRGRGCQYCRFGSWWAALQLARTVGVQCRGDSDPDCIWGGSKCSALSVGVALLQTVSTKIAEDNGVIEDFEPTRLKSLGPIVRVGASWRCFHGAVMRTSCE